PRLDVGALGLGHAGGESGETLAYRFLDGDDASILFRVLVGNVLLDTTNGLAEVADIRTLGLRLLERGEALVRQPLPLGEACLDGLDCGSLLGYDGVEPLDRTAAVGRCQRSGNLSCCLAAKVGELASQRLR